MARATGGRGDAPPPAALLIRDRKKAEPPVTGVAPAHPPRPGAVPGASEKLSKASEEGRVQAWGTGHRGRVQAERLLAQAPRPEDHPPRPPSGAATRPFCPSGGRDQRLKFHLVTTRAPAHPGPLKLCGCPATAASGEPPGPRESSEKWGFWALATGGTLGQLPHPWGAPWGIRDRVS